MLQKNKNTYQFIFFAGETADELQAPANSPETEEKAPEVQEVTLEQNIQDAQAAAAQLESTEKTRETCSLIEDFPDIEAKLQTPDVPHAEGQPVPPDQVPTIQHAETTITLKTPLHAIRGKEYNVTIIKKPTGETIAYIKDKRGEIFQVRRYAADGTGTIQEQRGDKVGNILSVDETTGDEILMDEKSLLIRQEAAEELSKRYPSEIPSRFEMAAKSFKRIFMWIQEFKAWKESVLDGPMAYARFGKDLSPEWKRYYARIKYRISEKTFPGVFNVFKSLSVDSFLGDNPAAFFTEGSYEKFLNGDGRLSKRDLNKKAFSTHLAQIRQNNSAIKEYPNDNILTELYLSLLINSQDSLNRKNADGLSQKVTERFASFNTQRINIAGEKEEAEDPKKEKISTRSVEVKNIFPEDLTIDAFLGTKEEVREIYGDGEVTIQEIQIRIKDLNFLSYENLLNKNNLTAEQYTQAQYLENIKIAYESAAKEFYPLVAKSVVDLIDEKATSDRPLNESNDGFLDYDEYTRSNDKETINSVIDFLTDKKIEIQVDGEKTEIISFNREETATLCNLKKYEFCSLARYSERQLMAEFRISKNDTQKIQVFQKLQKLSKDFARFATKQGYDENLSNLKDKGGKEVEDLDNISVARLFELTGYLRDS